MKTKVTLANWLEIAEAFGTPYAERTLIQNCLTHFSGGDETMRVLAKKMNIDRSCCLCWALEDCGVDFPKDDETPDLTDTVWWPKQHQYDQARSDFALLMWAMGDRGFNDLMEYAEAYEAKHGD